MENTNDISIGQDKWIRWKNFDHVPGNLLSIDSLLESSWPFWSNLETQCVAACCGIDAFSFWPENIKKASQKMDKQKLISALTSLKYEILRSDTDVIISSKLNNIFEKSVFALLLDHILESI